MTRAALPRTSSSKSGFFFCGMALLPVEYGLRQLDESVRGRGEQDHLFGQRLRWAQQREASRQNSIAKSRSLVASMLFAVGPSKPNSAAWLDD